MNNQVGNFGAIVGTSHATSHALAVVWVACPSLKTQLSGVGGLTIGMLIGQARAGNNTSRLLSFSSCLSVQNFLGRSLKILEDRKIFRARFPQP